MKTSEALLPGEDLVKLGLSDLAEGQLTDHALLVLVVAPRLKRLGIKVPTRHFSSPIEHLLYANLEKRLGPAAHSYYNSLLRRIDSFAHALERERSHSGFDRQ